MRCHGISVGNPSRNSVVMALSFAFAVYRSQVSTGRPQQAIDRKISF
jgi:hypothetical protein